MWIPGQDFGAVEEELDPPPAPCPGILTFLVYRTNAWRQFAPSTHYRQLQLAVQCSVSSKWRDPMGTLIFSTWLLTSLHSFPPGHLQAAFGAGNISIPAAALAPLVSKGRSRGKGTGNTQGHVPTCPGAHIRARTESMNQTEKWNSAHVEIV